jgi:TrmH family RNA methyltransferase
MSVLIESVQNRKIKEVVELLDKPKRGRDAQVFAVEGVREVSRALDAGYIPHSLFYLPHLHPDPVKEFRLPQELPWDPVASAVDHKMAYREGTEGVVAVMHRKNLGLANLSLLSNPLVLVIEAVEKPGNIGAMLRTADAAQVDAVLVCDPPCDLYNPNLIRASLGALFTRQVAVCSAADAVDWLRQNRLTIYVATLQDAVPYYRQDYTRSCAIVVGSEAQGLSSVWRNASCTAVHIPMRGAVDSLNVSVSAAIIVFEALRQRENGGKVG